MQSTKQFLRSYREAALELESLHVERERLMSMLYPAGSDPSRDGGFCAGPADPVGEGVSGLVDVVRRIDEEVKFYTQVRDEVRGVVRAVMHRNIVQGQSLHYRYVMFDEPAQAAYDMGYDPSSERRIHREALKKAAEVIAERGETGNLPAFTRPNRGMV